MRKSSNVNETNVTFSIEEELRYAIRFEEGYDIPDERYEAWLRINHPPAIGHNPGVSTLQTTPSSTPVSPPCPSSSQHTPSTSSALDVSHPSTSATPCRLNQVAKTGRSPLSDLLNLPVQSTKPAKTGKARVLTSSECLRLLLEKEEEKKRVAQEKEKRKRERELKKKQKEEEQKRKAEEKVRKTAEREAAKALKEMAKADREAAKLAEKEKKKKDARKPGAHSQKRQTPPMATTTRAKRNKLKENADDYINADLCCVCFGSYQEDIGTGREWLQCSCTRWIHEDCVDDEDVEEEGGRLCPLC